MNEIDFDKFPDSAVISVTKEEMLEILSVVQWHLSKICRRALKPIGVKARLKI